MDSPGSAGLGKRGLSSREERDAVALLETQLSGAQSTDETPEYDG